MFAVEWLITIYVISVVGVFLTALFFDPTIRFAKWAFYTAASTVIAVTIILVAIFAGSSAYYYLSS